MEAGLERGLASYVMMRFSRSDKARWDWGDIIASAATFNVMQQQQQVECMWQLCFCRHVFSGSFMQCSMLAIDGM